ncbi:MAG: hypothetical protein ACHQT5_02115 [Candidatus Saccharimonadales bacterium]|jgi:hypothetical protein
MSFRSIGTATHFPNRDDLGEISVLVDGVEQPLFRLPDGNLFLVSRPGSAYQVQMVVPQSGDRELVIFDSENDDSGGQGAYPTGRLGNVLTDTGTFVLDNTGDIQGLPLKFKRGTGFTQCVLYFEYRGGYSGDPFPMLETSTFQRGARLGELTIHYGSALELMLRLIRLKKTE